MQGSISSHVFIARKCQKIGFVKFCRHFQKLFVRLRKQKSELGCVIITGVPEEAVESFSKYAWSQIGGPTNVLFGYRANFLKLFLPFCDNLLRHHRENCLRCVSTIILNLSWMTI